MRVCDKCRECIDNGTKYMITVQCFNSIGQYVGSESQNLELCPTCYKKIFKENN
jgi:hypothetical protein